MKRTATLFTWTWMIALLTTTVGISIHQVYCLCKREKSVSFLLPASDACQHLPSGCCTKPSAPKTSCCKSLPEKPPACCADNKPCKEQKTQVYQLKVLYTVEQQQELQLDIPEFFHDLPLLRHFFRTAVCSLDLPPSPASHSPPLSGRQRCVLYQTFLI